MNFAEQLKAERQRLRLTQPEAAEALSLKDRVYWDYENGKTVPHEIAQEGALARLAKLKRGGQPKPAAQTRSPNPQPKPAADKRTEQYTARVLSGTVSILDSLLHPGQSRADFLEALPFPGNRAWWYQ